MSGALIRKQAAAGLKAAKKAAGGNVGLSKLLGGRKVISSQAISQWQRVPAARVIEVERATGVPRDQLRPDIYPAPTASAAS